MDHLTIEEFNTQFNLMYPYMDANKVRLLISVGNMNLIKAIFKTTVPPNTPMNWQDTWALYADAGNRTTILEHNLAGLRKQAEAQIAVICNDIPVSVWTDADRSTLMRKTGAHKKAVRHKDAIDISCFGIVDKPGGGELNFGCRDNVSTGRPSLPDTEGVTGVIISYSILDKGVTTGLPASPDDCQKQKAFPGATFLLQLGAENEGKMLHYFLQWDDAKHPVRLGVAGELHSVMIG
jgi:hypothetical protein